MIVQTDRDGRMDLWVPLDDDSSVVGEFKTTDWDLPSYASDSDFDHEMTHHIGQVESYVYSEDNEGGVTPFIEYQNRPSDPGRVKAIEDAFAARNITVLWSIETGSLDRLR